MTDVSGRTGRWWAPLLVSATRNSRVHSTSSAAVMFVRAGRLQVMCQGMVAAGESDQSMFAAASVLYTMVVRDTTPTGAGCRTTTKDSFLVTAMFGSAAKVLSSVFTVVWGTSTSKRIRNAEKGSSQRNS